MRVWVKEVYLVRFINEKGKEEEKNENTRRDQSALAGPRACAPQEISTAESVSIASH